HVTRQRRGQIVAQRDPLLVVVLEREHALIRPVLVGQEFAERVGELHRRRFHRLEAVALIDFADFLDHPARGGNRRRATIFQPARQAGAEFLGFFGFFSHGARWYQPRRGRATVSHGPEPTLWGFHPR